MAIELSEIRQIIKDKIRNEQFFLHDVKQIICDYIGAEMLNNIDTAYVERKYIKYNFEFLLQDAKFIVSHAISEGKNIFEDIYEFLSNFDYTLQIIPEIFKTSNHYTLLNNYAILNINEITTRKFIISLKKECACYLESISESTRLEINFLEQITEYLLDNNTNTQYREAFKFNDFSNNKCNLTCVLECIVNGYDNDELQLENFEDIVIISKQLINNSSFILEEKIRQRIKECLMPVRIVRKKLQGRNIIEVIGNCIVLSEIKDDIECRLDKNTKSTTKPTSSTNAHEGKKRIFKLKSVAKFVRAASALNLFDEHNEIHEVRLIGTRSITIDCDLEKNIWHGKNIVVITKKIFVTKDVTWNVSGLDSNKSYDAKAADSNSVNEAGITGQDGFAGESGGNVLLQAEWIKNEHTFEIISNGGNGSKGQNGGNGFNGSDGEGISLQTFQSDYPHGATWKVFMFSINEIQRLNRRNQIIQKIKDLSAHVVEVNSYNGTYIQGTTSKGQKITFSRYTAWLAAYHEYLVFQGSPGCVGSKAGLGGFGGQGGYQGEVSVSDEIVDSILIQTIDGKIGEDGKGGQNGTSGKDGCDIAYTDYEYHANVTYYGEHGDKKLKMNYYTDSASNRVYCEKEKRYLEVNTRKMEPQMSATFETSKSESENQERQHHANASRQKSISKKEMSTMYSRMLNSTDSLTENIKALTDNIQKMGRDTLIAQEKNVESKTSESMIRQVTHSSSKDKSHTQIMMCQLNQVNIANQIKPSENQVAEILLEISFNDEYLRKLEVCLKSQDLSIVEFNQMYTQFLNLTNLVDCKSKSQETSLFNVKNLFLNKFKYIALSDANIELSSLNTDFEPNNEVIYLEECSREAYIHLNHHALGHFADYFLPGNAVVLEKAYEYFKQTKQHKSEDLKLLHIECIVQFVIGKYYTDFPEIDQKVFLKYREEYSKHLREKEEKLESGWRTLRKKLLENLNKEENKARKHKLELGKKHEKGELKKQTESEEVSDAEEEKKTVKYKEERIVDQKLYKRESRKKKKEDEHKVDDEIAEDQEELEDEEGEEEEHIDEEEEEEGESESEENNGDEDKKEIEDQMQKGIENVNEELESTPEIEESNESADGDEKVHIVDNFHGIVDHEIQVSNKAQLTDDDSQLLQGINQKKKIIENHINMPEIRELESLKEQFGKFESNFKDLIAIKKSNYNWRKCINNDKILNKFKELILNQGIDFDLFASFLCEVFGIGLKIYEGNSKDGYLLKKIFKPKNKYFFHVLKISRDTYTIMKTQDDLIDLKIQSLKNNFIYGNIILDLFSLDTIQGVSQYLNNKEYENYNHKFDLKLLFGVRIKTQALTTEDQCIENILSVTSVELQKVVNEKINKLKTNCIGNNIILNVLNHRFCTEGIKLSMQALSVIIIEIISEALDIYPCINKYAWVLATKPQNRWLHHILNLRISNTYGKEKDGIQNILNSFLEIEDENIVICFYHKFCQNTIELPIEELKMLAQLLQKIWTVINVDEFLNLDLSEWKYNMWVIYWTNRISKTFGYLDETLDTAVYYTGVLQNKFGEVGLNTLFSLFESNISQYPSNAFLKVISSVYNGNYDIQFVNKTLQSSTDLSIFEKNSRLVRNEQQILDIIADNSNNSADIKKQVSDLKNDIDIIDSYVNSFKFEIENTDFSHLQIDDATITETLQFINSNCISKFNIHNFLIIIKILKSVYNEQIIKGEFDNYILALIDQAIFITRKGARLRYTQKIAILCLLRNERSILAQLNTGEGKSLIVVSLAIVKALRGEKVDIITCSRLLAQRDAEAEPPKGYKDIYNLFGIDVSHNCSENIEDRIKAYSANQIVYGDIGSFQRDFLLDRFFGKNIIGDRNFQNIIVDEVDSMLLDKGNNMLYLSQEIAGLDKLEAVFLCIWQIMNSGRDIDVECIRKNVLSQIFNRLEQNDLRLLDQNLQNSEIRKIWSELVERKIISNEGEMLKSSSHDKEPQAILTGLLSRLNRRLHYLLCRKSCIENNVETPKYLQKFILLHIESWINSALSAMTMKEGTDYVVDVDRSSSCPDRNPIITIVDNDTGTDLSNSQWENGLHQFLQLKHGCRISAISLKAVFVSNVRYFKLYTKMHGLSGTLGSKVEREFLQEVHNVDFVSIPTAKVKTYEEYAPVLCKTEDEWHENIFKESVSISVDKERAILIICDTILSAENMHTYLKTRLKANTMNSNVNLHLYKRDYEEFQFAQGNTCLQKGDVIIATNLAGRGTDIKLSEELVKNGGMHVCLSFLPANDRVEQQAFGRSARCGEPGSGRLIVCKEENHIRSGKSIVQFKLLREKEESKHISTIKSHYRDKIEVEETYFKKFQKIFSNLREKLDVAKSKTKNKKLQLICECLKKIILEEWAWWLDEFVSNKTISFKNKEEKSKQFKLFLESLSAFETFIKPLNLSENQWLTMFTRKHFTENFMAVTIISNPMWFTKIGMILNNMQKLENAEFLFNMVITKEPKFCESAVYYKSFILLQNAKSDTTEGNQVSIQFKDAINSLNLAKKLFKKRYSFCYQFASCIGEIEQRSTGRNAQIIKIEALKEQKIREASTYNLFLESIDNILGRPVTQNDITIDVINEYNARKIYNALLCNGVITEFTPSATAITFLPEICRKYHISKSTYQQIFNSQQSININNVMQRFQSELPNYNELWSMLLENKFISHEEKLLCCNMEQLALVDPSLCDKIRKEIERKSLVEVHVNLSDLTYLYSSTQLNSSNGVALKIFLENDFMTCVGNERFQRHKSSEDVIFTSIKRAIITKHQYSDSTKDSSIDSCSDIHSDLETFTDSDVDLDAAPEEEMKNNIIEYSLYKYDSITKNHFTNSLIDCESLETIFKLLIEKNVLIECDAEKGAYKLGGFFNSISNTISNIDTLYSEEIIKILKFRFMYRIALEDLILQTMDTSRTDPYNLSVPSQPALDCIYELIGTNIIEPCKISGTELEVVDNIITNLYPNTYSGSDIINILKEYAIDFNKNETFEILSELVNAKWLRRVMNLYVANVSDITNFTEEYALSDKYEIILEDHQPLSLLKHEEASLKMIFKLLGVLSGDSIRKTLTSTLKGLVPILKSTKEVKWKLDAIKDLKHERFLDQDIAVFILNELEYLISIEDTKMTWREIFSASAVIGLGILQLGVAIYTAVYYPNLSKVCVSEGINDMLYGFQALYSGKFSWKDYGCHKVQSVITSIAVVGACSFLSGGASMNLPSNTFDPNIANQAGKKLAEMSSAEIVKFAGMKTIGKKAFGMISKQVLYSFKGVAISHIVQYISQNYLQPFCEWLSTKILKFMEYFDFGKNKIMENLKLMCTSFGFTKSMEIFKRYINEVFHGESIGDILSKYCSSILGTVQKVINEVDVKSNYGNIVSNVKYYLYYISKFREAVTVILNISNLAQSLTIYIDRINAKIEADLKNKDEIKNKISDEEIEKFKTLAEQNLKDTMKSKAHSYIQKHILEPFLKLILEILTSAAISYGQKKYVQRKEANERKTFNEIVEKKAELANNSELSETDRDTLGEKYNEQLVGLMQKTRNPELFADIIAEGVPMDNTSVNCAVNIVANLPEFANKNVKFVVKTDDMQQEFSANKSSDDEIIITLEVKDNHFVYGDDATNNNCLFEAIKTQCEENGIDVSYSPEEFRKNVANNIRTNESVQHAIKFGWHEFSMSKGAIGGARRLEDATPEEARERARQLLRGEEVSESYYKREKIRNEEGQVTDIVTVEVTRDGKRYRYEKSVTTEIYNEVRNELDLTDLDNVIYKIQCTHIHDDVVDNEHAHEHGGNENVRPHGPTYVGKTININERKEGHARKYRTESQRESTNYLVAKHGIEQHEGQNFNDIFDFEVLLPGDTNTRAKEVLCQMIYDSLKHVGGMSHK